MLSPIKPLQLNLTEGQKRVLAVIRQHGTLPRTKIAELTGFGTGSVTTLCKELLTLQLIQESERVKGGRGQPAKPVSLSPYAAFTFGVAFHIARIDLALANFTGEILDRVEIFYDESQPVEETIILIRDAISKMTAKHRLLNARILGIGVSMPGPHLCDGKRVRTINQMAHWQDVDLADAFGHHFEYPVWIDNDCKVAAVGEYYSGLWDDIEHLVLIEIGHGIGGAVIMNGKLHSGRHNNSGEIGTYFNRSEAPRPCLRELIIELQEAGLDVVKLEDIPDIEHPIVASWIKRSAERLMPALLLTLSWFDPECIVIGGSSPKAISDALIKEMDLATEWEKRFDYPVAEIAPSKVGTYLSSYGASMYPFFQTLSYQT